MPRPSEFDDDRTDARHRRKKGNSGLIVGLAVGGGVLALVLVGGCVGLAWVASSRQKVGTDDGVGNPAGRAHHGSDEPIPDSFDPNDARRSAHWVGAYRQNAPYPLAEETGNAFRDKTRAAWFEERNQIIARQPVRWKVRIARVNDKGEAVVYSPTWPITSVEDSQRWANDNTAEWAFDRFELRITKGRDFGEYPILDKEWAKTVGRGTEAILVGWPKELTRAEGGTTIEWSPGKYKSVLSFNLVIPQAHLEKP